MTLSGEDATSASSRCFCMTRSARSRLNSIMHLLFALSLLVDPVPKRPRKARGGVAHHPREAVEARIRHAQRRRRDDEARRHPAIRIVDGRPYGAGARRDLGVAEAVAAATYAGELPPQLRR